jgi:hypothetical protein
MPLPAIDRRLQDRYVKLVKEQSRSAKQIAAGFAALPGVGAAFTSTQAAWRFLNNDAVTVPKLAAPLRQVVRDELAKTNSPYFLALLDWSKIDYSKHPSKQDRIDGCNHGEAGYALTSVLAVDVIDGLPLGPLEMNLEASFGTLTTRQEKPQTSVHYLEQVTPLMEAVKQIGIAARPVWTMDREFDSVEHYRAWHRNGQLFLVRADLKRLVNYRGEQMLLTKLLQILRRENQFEKPKEVEFKGKSRYQHVAEVEVVLDRPAWKHRADGTHKRVPGEPLTLRLIVSEIRDRRGAVLSTWLLFTNVPPDVNKQTLAQWYLWRWQIETFFKLIKTAGVCIEEWQQETAIAVFRRLLVACMSCVIVWRLTKMHDEASESSKRFLVRLSGRQMQRHRSVTASAMLEGLRVLFVMLDVLEHHTIPEILSLAKPVTDYLQPP